MPTQHKHHIVIDARIRRASTGTPVKRLLDMLQTLDTTHRYTCILQHGDDWQPTGKNFSIVYTRLGNFSFNPINQLRYSKLLYSLKPDLVYFTLTPQQPLFYFGLQATLTHDLTMLKFVRAGRLPQWLHALRMKGYRLLLWSAHRRAAQIVTPTQYVYDAVRKYHLFTSRKTTTILEAGEPPLQIEAERPEQAPDSFILYVGSAFPHKNLERLVSAFCLLKEQHPDLKLVLAGKREYHRSQLERWIKKQPCADDVVSTGFVSDAELKWYYEHATAYVFPSLSEGFGLPSLEAMAHGCPVVSSDATCLPEVNGDAAIYFNPEDIQEMAQKIDEVLSNAALRKKLVEKGYQNVKRFSWRTFTQQHIQLFDQLLAKKQ